MVERTRLADGLEISRVVTGLWQVADMERTGDSVDADRAAEAMHRYVEAGFTTFDMADHYGSAELIAGRLEARWPGSAEVLTKWVPTPGPITPADARAAVERALERTGRDAIDLLQVHAWRYCDPSWLDSVFALDQLRREGLIRHLGLTNVDTAHLRVLLHTGVRVASNQVCYSLIDRRPASGMSELCIEHDVKLLAYGTLAGGFLSERWLGAPEPAQNELTTWSEMKYKRFIDAVGGWDAYQRVLVAAAEVAERRGVSIANVASRFVLDDPAVAAVIVGARLGASEHREDNERLFETELAEGDVAALKDAIEALRPIPGDCGDEYRRPPYLTAAGDLSHHVGAFPPPYPTEKGEAGRTLALSGTPWEALAGFARAVCTGSRILVSGTTATHRDRPIGGHDPAAQAHFCVDKLEGAIVSLGGRLEDVVRTRVYVARAEDADAVSRVHGARFGHVRPANTLVRAELIGEGYLVEMEAEAEVGRPLDSAESWQPPTSGSVG